ncbi:MAG TPA: TIGR03560 family F420-dependent LLM class oxidoreductase [Acidimicrobiales bacterium]|nr:TIGR03560 family F420-dependent LLM class oxidoreductase [Acidimicrobiales bacterium]
MEVRGRPVHFGVQLQGQATGWEDYAAAVHTVEEMGFGSIWIFDHLLAPFDNAEDRPCFETLTTLGALALMTERVRIGALVNGVLYRDPAVLAKASAQVDEMSHGRLDFSLGAAWAEREFRAYGMPFPPLAERYARLDEALTIIKALWAQRRTTFHGRYYQLDDAPCEPKPVQSPHPPITIGGSGGGSLRVAALHADRLNMQGTPEKCARTAQRLRELCEEAGRDFNQIELSHHPAIVVRAGHEQAYERAMETARANSMNPDEVRDNWLIGTPAEVTDRVRQYLAVGVNHFVVGAGYPFDFESLGLLQEAVLPALE